jgi:hypothetical protein
MARVVVSGVMAALGFVALGLGDEMFLLGESPLTYPATKMCQEKTGAKLDYGDGAMRQCTGARN